MIKLMIKLIGCIYVIGFSVVVMAEIRDNRFFKDGPVIRIQKYQEILGVPHRPPPVVIVDDEVSTK